MRPDETAREAPAGVVTSTGMDDHATDAEVVAESLRCPEAFARLFDRHHDRIHGFVSRRLGPEVAADVASETFLVAFRRRAAYDQAYGDAAPWLYGIAVRLSRAHRRAERRRLREPAAFVAVTDDDPLASVDARLGPDERGALRVAMAGLPRGERDALALLALADLTYEEVGRALGVAPGTVASRISRARTRLVAAVPQLRPESAAPPGPVAVPKEVVDG